MRRVIFNIEDRAYVYIFHWFIYMVSGFRYIEKGCCSSGNDGKGKFEQNKKYYDHNLVNKPYNLYLLIDSDKMTNYQKETMELLKDDFHVMNKCEIQEDDIVINNYGEYITNTDYHISPHGYEYLRNLQNKIDITEEDKIKYNKKYYLCRSKSNLLEGNLTDNGIKRRHVVNEIELINELKKFNIESIFLEDFSLQEKIKIFKFAKTIISPNSGGLTFTLFSDNTNIIEMNVDIPSQIHRQYADQCRYFNIPYYKFTCQKIDINDNMEINIDEFISFLTNKMII